MIKSSEWIREYGRLQGVNEENMTNLIEKIQADALHHAVRIVSKYLDFDELRYSLPMVDKILESIPV